MLIAVTNPTRKIPAPAGRRKKPSTRAAKSRTVTKEAPVKRKHHKAARAAKRTKRKVHRNPGNPRHYFRKKARRRVHRNPSMFKGGVLGELFSKDGLLMIGGAFVAPMTADFLQEKLIPTATGWMKIGVKAAIIGAGAFAIDRFLKQRKAAVAFGVTGAAVLASDAVRLWRGQMAGLSEGEADWLSTRPEILQAVERSGSLGAPYQVGLAAPYQVGLADAFGPAFG